MPPLIAQFTPDRLSTTQSTLPNLHRYSHPPESPNYVGNPGVDQSHFSDTASVQVRDVVFQKNYIGSLDGISSWPNLTIGETGLFQLAITLPAGQIHDLSILDVLPAGLTYISPPTVISNPSISLPALNVYLNGQNILFAFNGTTNTTNGTNTFYINLTVRANNNTAYPGSTNVTARNSAYMDWNDPGHSLLPGQATVYIVQPLLNVTKSFNPSTIQGGQTTTVTITVKNTGKSTAYNVTILFK